ncbi:type II secretion system protein GspG [Nannocystaceae bacterium ST9]
MLACESPRAEVESEFEQAKLEFARTEAANIANAAMIYQLQTTECPATIEELVAGRTLQKATPDPWGNAYRITCPGTHDAIDVASSGPDGVPGNADDVGSWTLSSDRRAAP